jgi:hypothetical protein
LLVFLLPASDAEVGLPASAHCEENYPRLVVAPSVTTALAATAVAATEAAATCTEATAEATAA